MHDFEKIRSALPWVAPDIKDDIVAEIQILILENRIDPENVAIGIKRHLPTLLRKYKSTYGRFVQTQKGVAGREVSLDAPIFEDHEAKTLAHVIVRPALPPKTRCPQCKKKINPGRTYCSPTCALKFNRRKQRKIDPDELRELHINRRLPRSETAKAFGVTVNGVNSAQARNGIVRHNRPTHCITPGCSEPVRLKRHVFGYLTGTLCETHDKERMRKYVKKSREKKRPPLTAEQRKEHARTGSNARWERHRLFEHALFWNMV